jgi:hypothetical protein
VLRTSFDVAFSVWPHLIGYAADKVLLGVFQSIIELGKISFFRTLSEQIILPEGMPLESVFKMFFATLMIATVSFLYTLTF